MVIPLPIPSQFKDALHALREDRDNIRTLLSRAPGRGRGSEGPKWVIDQFDVLQDLLDSETRGKEGREFELAEAKVKRIIKKHVIEHVESKYMLDKDNEVVEIEIDHSQQTDILPRPTDDGSTRAAALIPLSAHGLQQRQQQQPLPLSLPSWNRNPNPFMMLPGGMIPIPINVIQQTGTFQYGTVNNTITKNSHHHHHHHEGASEEEIEKLNENLTGIREEQKKQSKEIGDLKSSHSDLQTTVHQTLKKKPKPSSDKALCDATPTKLFGDLVNFSSGSSPLAGEPHPEDTFRTIPCPSPPDADVTNTQRALRDLTLGSTNGTLIERLDDDTEAGKRTIPEETCQGEKENATTTASKNRRVIRPDISGNPNWNQIVLFGESAANARELRSQPWDFRHLEPTLEQINANQPEKDLYLVQGPPFLFKQADDEGDDEGVAQADTCPTLVIVIVPHGETPPEFVVMCNPEEMTETVIPFEDFGVEWKRFQPRTFGNNVYALKQKQGVINTNDLELTKLWTLPEDKLRRKDDGTDVLDVKKAVFEFHKPDGGIIREWYDKGMSTYSNICSMHGLVVKDENGEPIKDDYGDVKYDPEQFQALKTSIKYAFDAVRTEREDQIRMLNQKHPSFATNSLVKVFPQNKVVLDYFHACARSREADSSNSFFEMKKESASESPFATLGYISEWYGTAGTIVPDPNEARS